MFGVRSRERPGNRLRVRHAVPFGLFGSIFPITLYFSALAIGGQRIHEFVLGGENDERNAEDGIHAGGEDFDRSG